MAPAVMDTMSVDLLNEGVIYGIGQSSAVGIGGDPVNGTDCILLY